MKDPASAALELVAKDPIKFAIGAAVIVGAVYFVARHAAGAAAGAAVGLVSGENALTKDTPYSGAGAVGTVAAAADKATGGTLSSIGSALGGWLYEITHDEYDPNDGLHTAGKTLRDGAKATDDLWGRLGAVQLRY